MLAQVNTGIADSHGYQEIADISLLILVEERQQGGQGKDGSGMAGGKAGKTDVGHSVDKIRVLAGGEELLGPGHGKDVLQDLGKECRDHKGRDQLAGAGPAPHQEIDDTDGDGEYAVAEESKVDEKGIQGGAVVGI